MLHGHVHRVHNIIWLPREFIRTLTKSLIKHLMNQPAIVYLGGFSCLLFNRHSRWFSGVSVWASTRPKFAGRNLCPRATEIGRELSTACPLTRLQKGTTAAAAVAPVIPSQTAGEWPEPTSLAATLHKFTQTCKSYPDMQKVQNLLPVSSFRPI